MRGRRGKWKRMEWGGVEGIEWKGEDEEIVGG